MTGTVSLSFASRFWNPILSGSCRKRRGCADHCGYARSLSRTWFAGPTAAVGTLQQTPVSRLPTWPSPTREGVHKHTLASMLPRSSSVCGGDGRGAVLANGFHAPGGLAARAAFLQLKLFAAEDAVRVATSDFALRLIPRAASVVPAVWSNTSANAIASCLLWRVLPQHAYPLANCQPDPWPVLNDPLKDASSLIKANVAARMIGSNEGQECTDWLETSRISMTSHLKAVATVALKWLGDGRILDHKPAAL
jgi:hypothetical protein